MVSELSLWFLHPGFDPRRAQFYFSKNKLTERSLKCACHSVDWMVTEMRLKSTFPVIIQSPFSHHSVTIQSTERWDFTLCAPYSNLRFICSQSPQTVSFPSFSKMFGPQYFTLKALSKSSECLVIWMIKSLWWMNKIDNFPHINIVLIQFILAYSM